MKSLQRLLAVVLSLALINATVIQAAHAGLVSTEEVASLAAGPAGAGHARLAAALARDDVRAALQTQGVDPALAAERIAALTDDEATRLADKFDSAPAGGSIVGAILLVFFVLLLTDILGLTKVFPFTRSVR